MDTMELIRIAYPLNPEIKNNDECMSEVSTRPSTQDSFDQLKELDNPDPLSEVSSGAPCWLSSEEVSRALGHNMLAVQSRKSRILVEIGMGTGRTVLQAFLECSCLTKVVGVEIDRDHFAAAQMAVGRLAEAKPERFCLKNYQAYGFQTAMLRDIDNARMLEIWNGNPLHLPVQTIKIREADAIIAHVSSDLSVQQEHVKDIQILLTRAKHGCRLLSCQDLVTSWQLDARCCWHACHPDFDSENNKADEEMSVMLRACKRLFVFECNPRMATSIFKAEHSPNGEDPSKDSFTAIYATGLVVLGLAAFAPFLATLLPLAS
eukprot:gnl/MRDRNA2_/MRDRNA2_93813_c0_seq1.p1 gnl/MRDRNA2_/MRDRNA2_93813_c0~~gnl/MRDRNA2_/MRDRNA2_93813_c0_seq1.p1  ORF type:complete len:319 (+),score=60.34 gnl/MRDRNA2_/MRDRNA2_93813_c0_seq1:77-1033(+)